MEAQAVSLQEALREQGLRLTRQRRIVVEALDRAEGHLSARDLLRLARQADPTINRATVYRTLALLKSRGLIDELDLLHLEGVGHFYERRVEGDHAHIGCPGCGRIVEMRTELAQDLARTVTERTGFAPTSIRIEVRALCPACQASAA